MSNSNNNKCFADFSSTSPRFVAACCVYATVYEEAKCDKVVKGLRTCSSGQNASSAANCTRRGVTARWTFPPLPFDCCIGGSFSPEGETNRRSCAVHADNYLRSLPPYCFLNNNRLLHKLDSLSLSAWPGYEATFLFSGPAGPPTQLPFEGMYENKRIPHSRLLQEGELIFYHTEKSLCILKRRVALNAAYILIRI